jgi:type I restriction enzyme S subunit
MKVDFISNSVDKVTKEAVENSSVKLIPGGSLLLVVRGMILAHSFPVAITRNTVVINQDMKALVFTEIEENYLLLLMKSLKNTAVELVDRSSHGTCKLVSEKLWKIVLPMPSVQEQQRIVAKVDELMALCDSLKSRLNQAQTTQLDLTDAIVEQAL